MKNIVDKAGSMSRALALEINSGVFRTNERLPGERKLAEYYKVSRTTCRAVLDDFEKKGIVSRKSKQGTFVNEGAIQIIERDLKQSTLEVFFLMPPAQQTNPLLRTVFSTFQQYSNEKIQSRILFQNEVYDGLPYVNDKSVVVLFGIYDEKQLSSIARRVAKLVVLNKRTRNFDYISPDNHAGGVLVGQFLLDCGHHCVGAPIFDSENDDTDFERRFNGLRTTLEKAGATLHAYVISRGKESEPAEYERALNFFLTRTPEVTALACMSDKTAMNIYAKSNRLGIEIPDKISVIGFDDQYYAQYTCPPLTSVKYPAEAMGIHLANAMNDYLSDSSIRIEKVIEPILIKRRSVNTVDKTRRSEVTNEYV